MTPKPLRHHVTSGVSWMVVGVTVCFVVIASGICSYILKEKNVLGVTTDGTESVVKELFIPLGAGSNGTTEWTDVKGAAASIDSRLYGVMKKVVFEATLGVPTGNQTTSVRLYNATDKHPVWYSEMSLTGAGPELLVSGPITLDWGNKTYQVQVKSQLGNMTQVLQTRIHILLQ